MYVRMYVCTIYVCKHACMYVCVYVCMYVCIRMYVCMYVCKRKGEVVPLEARCGPQGSRRFRLQNFHDMRHMKVVRSSASRTGRLYPQECSWYSFSLGAESIPGPWYGSKEICH
jgi:hypothetical protein